MFSVIKKMVESLKDDMISEVDESEDIERNNYEFDNNLLRTGGEEENGGGRVDDIVRGDKLDLLGEKKRFSQPKYTSTTMMPPPSFIPSFSSPSYNRGDDDLESRGRMLMLVIQKTSQIQDIQTMVRTLVNQTTQMESLVSDLRGLVNELNKRSLEQLIENMNDLIGEYYNVVRKVMSHKNGNIYSNNNRSMGVVVGKNNNQGEIVSSKAGGDNNNARAGEMASNRDGQKTERGTTARMVGEHDGGGETKQRTTDRLPTPSSSGRATNKKDVGKGYEE